MEMILDEELPRSRLTVLLKQFSQIEDRRQSSRVAFPLAEMLLLLTCATIADCDDFDEIIAWGCDHLDSLRRFAPFHFGIPCARWLRTLVNRLDPLLFGSCFESWIKELWPGQHDLIAIDGKTSRRTHDKRKGLKALHTLSAYATNARLVLGQLSVPEKTNELTAIPELLDHLAEAKQLEGALVTIDDHGLSGRHRGAALTIFSSWIVSFDLVLPRLPPPSPAGLSGFGSVAFSMPLGLIFGRRGPPFRRAISSA
jgi:hypothetical protein